MENLGEKVFDRVAVVDAQGRERFVLDGANGLLVCYREDGNEFLVIEGGSISVTGRIGVQCLCGTPEDVAAGNGTCQTLLIEGGLEHPRIGSTSAVILLAGTEVRPE